MAISVKHKKTSAIPDNPGAQAAGEILPSDWNDTHDLVMATARLLGRTTAGVGVAEEISVGTGLTLAAGSLAFDTAWGNSQYLLLGGGALTGNLSIATAKLTLGSTTRQMIDLWGTEYGVGVQNNALYQRTNFSFAWFKGGIHDDTTYSPGAGGSVLMYLNESGHLRVTGSVQHNSQESAPTRGGVTGLDTYHLIEGGYYHDSRNTPSAGSGHVHQIKMSNDWIVQMFYGTDNEAGIFYRKRLAGGWGNWYRLLDNRIDAWQTSRDGVNRFYFSNASATYISAASEIIMRPFNSGADSHRFADSNYYIRGTSPTVWWHDTDNRAFAIHVNSDLAYFMRGGVNDTTWTQITDSYGTLRYAMTLNLVSGNVEMAGSLFVYGSQLQGRDFMATRGDGTGVYYFGGNPNAYIYFNGSSYTLPIYPMTVGGAQIRVGSGETEEKRFALHNSSRLVYFYLSTGSVLGLWDDSGAINRWTTDTSGNFVATGNVTGFSDERLKTNFIDLSLSLEDILSVRTFSYTRTDTGAKQVGVKAQELQRILPLAVHQDDKGMLSVDYGRAALVMVIELAKEVSALRKRVKDGA